MVSKKDIKGQILRGSFWGVVAGLIDVFPMVLQKLPLVSDISAFAQWVVVGIFIASIDIGFKGILKGIVVAALAIVPVAILVAAQEPMSLIPIACMTLILGGTLGHILDR